MKKNMGNLSLFFSHNRRHHSNYDLTDGSKLEDGAFEASLHNSDFADENHTVGLSMIKDWALLDSHMKIIKVTMAYLFIHHPQVKLMQRKDYTVLIKLIIIE
jgi:hypothetical protein